VPYPEAEVVMSEIVRPSGVRVRLDDDVELSDNVEQAPTASARRKRSRGSMATAGAATSAAAQPEDETAALVAALEQDGMTLLDAIDVTPAAGAAPRRKRRSGGSATTGDASASIDLDVPIGDDEEAVLLVEEDGVYRWIYGEALAQATGKQRRSRGDAPVPRTKHFTLALALDDGADDGAPAARRARRRGLFGRTLLGKAVVFVFKFVARKAIGAIVRRKEKHVEPGLVALVTEGDVRFPRFDFARHARALPGDRPLKVLLFVHGTFSSTLGSYGWLDMTPDGKAFLEAAHREYDVVFGFDHRTLSETPLQNAEQLHEALAGLPNGAGAPRIDAIGYSRGGLVLRTLVEQVIPAHDDVPFEIGTCVFVASTHAGTALASKANVHRLVDTYTNLAAGTCRGVALIPGATPWAMLASTILSGLGEIVKDLAEWALEDGGIPGLAAMEPDGETVRTLNARLARDGTVRDYRVVQSTFDVDLASRSAMPGALDSFVTRLKDRITDKLMREANDLVVDVESMTLIGNDPSRFVKAVHDFGRNASVHHTNYFVQQGTIARLGEWLGLEATVATKTRRKRSRGAGAGDDATPGMATALVFADADEPTGALLDRLRAAPEAAYAIVVRGGGLRYAFTPDEVVDAALAWAHGDPAFEPLVATLDLHEWRATERAGTGDVAGAIERRHPDAPSSARRLVDDEHGAQVVGVLPSREDALDPARTLYPDAAREERLRLIDTLLGGRETSASPSEGVAGSEAPGDALPDGDDGDDGGNGGRRRRGGSRGGSRGDARDDARGPHVGAKPGRGGSLLDGPAMGGAVVETKPALPGSYTPPAKASTVALQFQAAYDAAWLVGEDATVDVTLSREQITELVRDIAVEGGAVQADEALPLTVHLLVRENAAVQGESSVEVAVPAANAPATATFTVRALAAGRVALGVEIWQNRVRLGGLQFSTKATAPKKKTPKSRRVPAATLLASGHASPVAPRAPVDVLRVSEDPSLPAPGATIRYDVSYEGVATDPRVRGQGYSDQLRRERREFIDAIYARIQDRWEEGPAADAFAKDLRAMGLELWNTIVPRRVQELLWERRATLGSLQVLSTEAYVPWEMVFMNEPGARRPHAEGKFMGELGLTRWLYGGDGTGFAPETLRWGKMVVVQPDYALAADRLPAAKLEADALVEAYRATRADATMQGVYDLVADGASWDVLHYCGHGEAEAGTIEEASLLLQVRRVGGEDKQERAYASTIAAEGKLREPGDVTSAGHVVVLNACQVGRSGESIGGLGGFAKAFVHAGAGLFVAPLWNVGDELAATFTSVLYERLVAGDTVAEATRAARTASRDAGDPTWIAYAVYGEPTARLVT
jgi:hypothetical protein